MFYTKMNVHTIDWKQCNSKQGMCVVVGSKSYWITLIKNVDQFAGDKIELSCQ